jgi:hypothetical protein
VLDATANTLTHKPQAEREAALVLKFRDGDLSVVPNGATRKSARPKEPAPRQGDLF